MARLLTDFFFAVLGFALLAILSIAAGTLYLLVGMYLRRRWGAVPLVLLWAATTIAVGYFGYVHYCNTGLTCDVGGVNYAAQQIPQWALLGAVGFGFVTALADRRIREGSRRALTVANSVLAGAGLIIAMVLVPLLIRGIDRTTCGNRAARLADGSLETQCQLFKEMSEH